MVVYLASITLYFAGVLLGGFPQFYSAVELDVVLITCKPGCSTYRIAVMIKAV